MQRFFYKRVKGKEGVIEKGRKIQKILGIRENREIFGISEI